MEKKPRYITLVLTLAEAKAVLFTLAERELRLKGLSGIGCFASEAEVLRHVNESLRSAIDEQ